MSDQNTLSVLVDQQRAVASQFSVPFLQGASDALRRQARVLRRVENLTSEMVRRQHEECAAAQHFVDVLRTAKGPLEMMQTQGSWLAEASQRLITSAAGWQSAGLAMVSELVQRPTDTTLPVANQNRPPAATAKAAE
jgi:hypothetical protein